MIWLEEAAVAFKPEGAPGSGAVIVTITAPEVLAAYPAAPPYEAVTEWLPTARFETASAADPPCSATVPIAVAPSRNCTLPVACAGDTVAVNVTVCPATAVDLSAESEVVVAASTVCVTAPEVAPL